MVAFIAFLALTSAAAVARAEPAPARIVEVWAATSDVWDVAVTPGRTLVATSGGLVERQGDRVVRVLGTREGLPGQRVRSVSLVGDAAWVGTVEGLAVVTWSEDGAAHVVRRLDLPRVSRVVGGEGAVWIAAAGRGLYRLADGEHAPERVRLGRALDRVSPTDLLVRAEPFELWVATQGEGVLRVGADGALRGRVALGAGVAADIVWDLAADGDHVLVATAAGLRVVGPDGGVDAADPRVAAAARLRVSDVRAVLPRFDGATWLATWGAGVVRLDDGARAPAAVSCPGCTRVRTLARDGAAVLVGHDAGLARARAGRARAEVLATGGLPSSDVTALARGLGALWIGTFDHGLARMTDGGAPEAMERATSRWGMDARINDLAVTRDAAGHETLWIATARGLWAHDGLRFWPVEAVGSPGSGYVMDLHVDAGGALWVASSRALCRWAGGRWTSWQTAGRRAFEKLHAVTTDARGQVWIGALHGLYVLEPRTGAIARYSVSSGALPMDWVTAVLPTADGVVAGTYAGGLVWFGPNGPVTEPEAARDAAAGALPSGWVNPHALSAMGETVLVGTPGAGLLVGHRGAWQRLGPREGLPATDVTATLEASPGELWVATRGGLARVRLER